MSVEIICLQHPHEKKHELVNGVLVHRLPLNRKRGARWRYLIEYATFILMAFFTVSCMHLRKRYDVVHIHTMPDVLVFCALLPKFRGAKVILDLHDPMPEVYMAKYSIRASHPMIRLLCWLEKKSIAFADLVLTPNLAFEEIFVARGCQQPKIHVIMNCPQESIFVAKGLADEKHVVPDQKRFVIMYHGTIVHRNGIDVALRALALVRSRISGLVFEVYGEGDFTDRFQDLVVELGLQDTVRYHGHVPAETIASAIRSIDLGLIPNHPSIHWEHALPTRIFEYLCLSKSVVAPRTKGILDYFDDNDLYFFESGNAASLATAIMQAYQDPHRRDEILARGIAVYRNLRWELQRKQLIRLVTSLVSPPLLL